MPKRIPVDTAKRIAKEHGLQQVILVAWDGEQTHVVTYGPTVEACDQAAEGGNRVKRALGWPESLCSSEPSRVRKLKDRIKELEARIKHGDDVARMVNRNLATRVKELEQALENFIDYYEQAGIGEAKDRRDDNDDSPFDDDERFNVRHARSVMSK